MGQNNQKSRCKYWATRSSVRSHRSLAHFAHSLARGTVIYQIVILSVFFPFWTIVYYMYCPTQNTSSLHCLDGEWITPVNRVEVKAWSSFLYGNTWDQEIGRALWSKKGKKHRQSSHPIIHCPTSKPGRFTLFLNNTNTNAILLSIGTIPIQYNTMQYLSVLTTIHPNIRMSTVWCKVMCGL